MIRSPSTATAPFSIGAPFIVTTMRLRTIMCWLWPPRARQPREDCTLPDRGAESRAPRVRADRELGRISAGANALRAPNPKHPFAKVSSSNSRRQTDKNRQQVHRVVGRKFALQRDTSRIVAQAYRVRQSSADRASESWTTPQAAPGKCHQSRAPARGDWEREVSSRAADLA